MDLSQIRWRTETFTRGFTPSPTLSRKTSPAQYLSGIPGHVRPANKRWCTLCWFNSGPPSPGIKPTWGEYMVFAGSFVFFLTGGGGGVLARDTIAVLRRPILVVRQP